MPQLVEKHLEKQLHIISICNKTPVHHSWQARGWSLMHTILSLRCNCNAVGEVPLKWYKDEDHIGYDRVGDKLIRKGKKDKLDALLDRNDNIKAWRTIYDEYNDEEITLSKEEVELIQRIRKGQFPHVEVNCFLCLLELSGTFWCRL